LSDGIILGMWPIRPVQWVGRERELAVLRAAVDALDQGEGTVAWVEGEPGIGKSSLVAEALAGVSRPGWDVGWAGADQLTARLPLRVMQDCLQVRLNSPDPRRAHAADLLRSRLLTPLADGGRAVNGIEVLLTLADELCTAAPTVLVVDDLQWADEESLACWHQLAASISQLRLLLIGTSRPTPRRMEVQQARAAVTRRAGRLVSLGPLPEADVTALVTAMIGSSSADGLRRLATQAAGNPLYVRELVDALLREQAAGAGPLAGVDPAGVDLPPSLAGVLENRLSSVSAETARTLRSAALLGGRFAVTDLAAVLRRTAWDLAASLEEAVTAGIVVGSGAELVFRHPLIRQALYESMPEALRMGLHDEAARELAAAGADTLSVAQQLSAANRPSKGWARTWLIQNAPALTTRAPQLAADLLRREADATPSGDETWDALTASLVWALLATGSYAEAARRAERALTVMTDPVRRAETYRVLWRAQVSARRGDDAVATIRRALASADLPGEWRARMLAVLAMLERAATGDVDAMEATASQALTIAEEVGDAFAMSHALADLWLTHGVRRDHAAALDCADRALRVLGDDPALADQRSYALEVRIFSLQNLDRWPEAELALQRTREFALRSGSSDHATWATAAVLRYWLGQWDDALAELNSDQIIDAPGLRYTFLREDWPALLVHGVAALIAGRREQRGPAEQHLRAGLAQPMEILTDLENRDFLVAAHALALEQGGEPGAALARLAGLLPRRPGEMTLTHQWLPDLTRLALTAGNRQLALAAVEACQQEASAETRPARATVASLRCYGLLESDPERLAEAVAHYRSVGPAAELPAALEDQAVVLAGRGYEEDARAALYEAVVLYEGMQARWDIRRAEGRLRPYGIRRGGRGRRTPRATHGWEALTPTEVKVAALVARGGSTSDIARSLFLSRRTVQTYISRILVKLQAKSRVDIVRAALLAGAAP
jgi:DNA-binding CsgD family transcriptional regulator